MRAGDGERLQAEVASVLDWWSLAGVGTVVGEAPRDWLAPVAARSASADAPPAAAPVQAPLPATLDAFLAWLAALGDEALLGPADRRVAPAGVAGAELFVLIDLPEAADADAGGLMSGPAGRLLDRMLAAIGVSREAAWIAPLCPARPAGGRIEAGRLARLGEAARHQIALVAPARILLMGAATAEAVLGEPIGSTRGRIHEIDGRQAVATFSPHILLGAPAMKAGAWADLRQMIKGDDR